MKKAWITGIGMLGMVAVMAVAGAVGAAPGAAGKTPANGIYWESEMTSGGLPEGMPANLPPEVLQQLKDQFNRKDVLKNYLSEDAFRSESGDGITIIDFHTRMIYNMDPVEKTCTRVDVASVNMGADQEMARMAADGIKVTPTQETRKIGNYSCRKYLVSMMMTQGEYWASKEVPGYDKMKTFGKKLQEVMSLNPMMRQFNVAGMMEQIDGFPVSTSMNAMGMTITTMLTRIEEKNLDKSLFEIPKDYKMVDMKDLGTPAQQ